MSQGSAQCCQIRRRQKTKRYFRIAPTWAYNFLGYRLASLIYQVLTIIAMAKKEKEIVATKNSLYFCKIFEQNLHKSNT